jgi:hypothetical protein
MQRGFHDGFDFFSREGSEYDPGRGASLRNPSRRRARKRSLHSCTLGREILNACAISIRPLCLKTRPFWTLAAAFFF